MGIAILNTVWYTTLIHCIAREFGAPNVYKQTEQREEQRINKKGERKQAFSNGKKDRRGFVHVKSTDQVCALLVLIFLHSSGL